MMSKVLCGVVFFVVGQAAGQGLVKKGFADLSGNTFQAPVALDGDWEFYWKELKYRGGFNGQAPHYFYFPSLWNGRKVGNRELQARGYATYRMLVVLPDSMEFSMLVEDMYSAFTLYLNGKPIARNGQVGVDKARYFPEWQPQYVPLTNLKDTNEVILQLANFDHSKGGAKEGIWIGRRSLMKRNEVNVQAFDLLLTGCLFMGGLFFIGLYAFGRHDKSILYFSLFCISSIRLN